MNAVQHNIYLWKYLLAVFIRENELYTSENYGINSKIMERITLVLKISWKVCNLFKFVNQKIRKNSDTIHCFSRNQSKFTTVHRDKYI
jgi:hypothetical protein